MPTATWKQCRCCDPPRSDLLGPGCSATPTTVFRHPFGSMDLLVSSKNKKAVYCGNGGPTHAAWADPMGPVPIFRAADWRWMNDDARMHMRLPPSWHHHRWGLGRLEPYLDRRKSDRSSNARVPLGLRDWPRRSSCRLAVRESQMLFQCVVRRFAALS